MTISRIRSVFAVVLFAASASIACGGTPSNVKAARAERHAPATAQVSDDAFAGAVRDLLTSEPASEERRTRLDGVVAKQMARAASRFTRKDDKERSVAAVLGALALVHTGELRDSSLGPKGKEALNAAVHEFAAHGEEGRARALYEILLRVSSSAEKAEIQAHLDALATWTKTGIDPNTPVETSAETQRQAVLRRLYEPSDAALSGAVSATKDWVIQAITLQKALMQRSQAPRSERYEAFRALQGGATTIAALYLRDGNVAGALEALDRGKLREWVKPRGLVGALEEAKNKPSADSWLAILHAIIPSKNAEDDDEPGLDPDLLQAAVFGISSEAYRHDPTSIEAAGALADSLQSYGMAEASGAVLGDAAKAHPDAATLRIAIGLTMRAIEADADDADAARRTFHGAKAILAAADLNHVETGADASAAKLRALMGDIELREGRLDEARSLLTTALAREPSGRGLLALARIEQHDGNAAAALADLKNALNAPDTTKDVSLRGDILLLVSEVAQSQGDSAGTKSPLEEALRGLTSARSQVQPTERARVERTLARVLDRYGLDKAAQRALERSLDAARNDKTQTSQTLSLYVARAFVRGDLASARDGLARASATDLSNDDLVYAALWVRLLERQLKAKPEPASERIFASVPDDGHWIGRIAAFGAGKIKADDLIASAKTPAQKTEALFYSAVDRRVAGDQKGAADGLRMVTASAGVELMETAMARDILRAKPSFGPPAGVAIP